MVSFSLTWRGGGGKEERREEEREGERGGLAPAPLTTCTTLFPIPPTLSASVKIKLEELKEVPVLFRWAPRPEIGHPVYAKKKAMKKKGVSSFLHHLEFAKSASSVHFKW